MSEEALQIAERRRETNGKEEKERYIHVNAKSQRRARRKKKAFVSDQRCGREVRSQRASSSVSLS